MQNIVITSFYPLTICCQLLDSDQLSGVSSSIIGFLAGLLRLGVRRFLRSRVRVADQLQNILAGVALFLVAARPASARCRASVEGEAAAHRLQLYHAVPCSVHGPMQTQQNSCLHLRHVMWLAGGGRSASVNKTRRKQTLTCSRRSSRSCSDTCCTPSCCS